MTVGRVSRWRYSGTRDSLSRFVGLGREEPPLGSFGEHHAHPTALPCPPWSYTHTPSFLWSWDPTLGSRSRWGPDSVDLSVQGRVVECPGFGLELGPEQTGSRGSSDPSRTRGPSQDRLTTPCTLSTPWSRSPVGLDACKDPTTSEGRPPLPPRPLLLCTGPGASDRETGRRRTDRVHW